MMTAEELLRVAFKGRSDIDYRIAFKSTPPKGGNFERHQLSEFRVRNRSGHPVDDCWVWLPEGRFADIQRVLSFQIMKPSRACSFFFFDVPDNRSRIELSLRSFDSSAIFLTSRKLKLAVKMVEGDNMLVAGEDCYVGGGEVVIHRTALFIGAGGLWSDGVLVQGADSHGVVDLDTLEIINQGKKSIILGRRVWLGRRSTVLKNVAIGDGSIVAAGSIVSKNVPPVCAVAGIPAKVVKRRVTWSQSSKTVTTEEKQFMRKMRKEIDEPKLESEPTRLSQWLAKLSRGTKQTS